jgi:hypothetical protein
MTEQLHRLVLLTLLTMGSASTLAAQGNDSSGIPILKVDLAARTFDKALPFDQPFYVELASSLAIKNVTLQYGIANDRRPGATMKAEAAQPPGTAAPDLKSWAFRIERLDANRNYQFQFQLTMKDDGHVFDDTVVGQTSISIASYVRSDVGVVWVPRLLRGVNPSPHFAGASSSVHLYFRPINDASESEDVPGLFDGILKRTSIVAGLVVADFRSDVTIQHLYSVGTPILGLSVRPLLSDRLGIPKHFRLINSLYFTCGEMYFNQHDADSLVTRPHGKRTTFWQIAGVADYKALLGPLAVLLGAK